MTGRFQAGRVSYPGETLYIDPISIDEIMMKRSHETRLEAE